MKTKEIIMEINNETGLTIKQEKAVALLVSGLNVTETSLTLEIDRSTLYGWMNKINFKAYYNKLCSETQKNIKNSIWGMHNDALDVIKDNLKSKNEVVKTKTAIWILEKLDKIEIGQQNPKEWIRRESLTEVFDMDFGAKLDKQKFMKLCEENNIK